MRKFVKNSIRTIVIIISLFIGTLLAFSAEVYAAGLDDFWVEFIDVGQGDCAIIQCDGHYMLIDGGSPESSSKIYTILKNIGIDKIDLMVATHPDEDHIGGLSGALNYSSVDTVLSPVITHDTRAFNSLLKYVGKQGKSLTVPSAGDVYNLGYARINIVGPIYSDSNLNNQSIVIKVTYGSTSFVFMGDAEQEEESSILRNFKGLECDVLKVGHHGSSSSTSMAWLNATEPTYSVISVGKNGYGHPTQETINNLTNVGSIIYRTDLQGDITFYSDGKNLAVETEKNVSPIETAVRDAGEKSPNPDIENNVLTAVGTTYVLNNNTRKFHYPTCSSVGDISAKNRQDVNSSREEIIAQGYVPCKRCNP